ncbi:MAG: hypothetical protein HDR24_07350 [Lachnospiraceae bacterium]|nr:hypothetical protein [Lachnospiraceae bacterium]
MRRQHREQILEMLCALSEAHDEIKSYLDNKTVQLADDLLIQCQEAAINIGNLIETSEGEGFVTVSLLEQYCETVFAIHEEIISTTVGAIYPDKTINQLNDVLIKIENSVKNDIHIRKEVVFLPYKASMWDSLESVWRAVDADPDCDAYVIPIPYYDRNPDGSLREKHYEGKEYPKDVPVIWYGDYNFEERRPDEIYIHNPYDASNIITSVEPYFYSSNLKQYTDKLVYIPYFVLTEVDPNDQSAVETVAHFVMVPGVINADKVIVQSENMRQVYIDVLSKEAGEHTRKIWEDKIFGTGSPKFDKVANIKKEDVEIPEEWLTIIRKPDGTWKKVIMYNNSVGALLEHSDKMLDKMKNVFRAFKENKDKVVLLWRPHPLIKATVASMRPRLWIEYDKLVKKYIEDGWGIYDDTADLGRAIAISDAYYGDQSSVVQLCQKAGMPVMIQRVEEVRNE